MSPLREGSQAVGPQLKAETVMSHKRRGPSWLGRLCLCGHDFSQRTKCDALDGTATSANAPPRKSPAMVVSGELASLSDTGESQAGLSNALLLTIRAATAGREEDGGLGCVDGHGLESSGGKPEQQTALLSTLTFAVPPGGAAPSANTVISATAITAQYQGNGSMETDTAGGGPGGPAAVVYQYCHSSYVINTPVLTAASNAASQGQQPHAGQLASYIDLPTVSGSPLTATPLLLKPPSYSEHGQEPAGREATLTGHHPAGDGSGGRSSGRFGKEPASRRRLDPPARKKPPDDGAPPESAQSRSTGTGPGSVAVVASREFARFSAQSVTVWSWRRDENTAGTGADNLQTSALDADTADDAGGGGHGFASAPLLPFRPDSHQQQQLQQHIQQHLQQQHMQQQPSQQQQPHCHPHGGPRSPSQIVDHADLQQWDSLVDSGSGMPLAEHGQKRLLRHAGSGRYGTGPYAHSAASSTSMQAGDAPYGVGMVRTGSLATGATAHHGNAQYGPHDSAGEHAASSLSGVMPYRFGHGHGHGSSFGCLDGAEPVPDGRSARLLAHTSHASMASLPSTASLYGQGGPGTGHAAGPGMGYAPLLPSPQRSSVGMLPVSRVSLSGAGSVLSLPLETGSLCDVTAPQTGLVDEQTALEVCALAPELDLWAAGAQVSPQTRIAQGAYGVVYRGLWHGCTCAVKMMLAASTENLSSQLTEVFLCKALSCHPNIVQTFDCNVWRVTSGTLRAVQYFCGAGKDVGPNSGATVGGSYSYHQPGADSLPAQGAEAVSSARPAPLLPSFNVVNPSGPSGGGLDSPAGTTAHILRSAASGWLSTVPSCAGGASASSTAGAPGPGAVAAVGVSLAASMDITRSILPTHGSTGTLGSEAPAGDGGGGGGLNALPTPATSHCTVGSSLPGSAVDICARHRSSVFLESWSLSGGRLHTNPTAAAVALTVAMTPLLTMAAASMTSRSPQVEGAAATPPGAAVAGTGTGTTTATATGTAVPLSGQPPLPPLAASPRSSRPSPRSGQNPLLLARQRSLREAALGPGGSPASAVAVAVAAAGLAAGSMGDDPGSAGLGTAPSLARMLVPVSEEQLSAGTDSTSRVLSNSNLPYSRLVTHGSNMTSVVTPWAPSPKDPAGEISASSGPFGLVGRTSMRMPSPSPQLLDPGHEQHQQLQLQQKRRWQEVLVEEGEGEEDEEAGGEDQEGPGVGSEALQLGVGAPQGPLPPPPPRPPSLPLLPQPHSGPPLQRHLEGLSQDDTPQSGWAQPYNQEQAWDPVAAQEQQQQPNDQQQYQQLQQQQHPQQQQRHRMHCGRQRASLDERRPLLYEDAMRPEPQQQQVRQRQLQPGQQQQQGSSTSGEGPSLPPLSPRGSVRAKSLPPAPLGAGAFVAPQPVGEYDTPDAASSTQGILFPTASPPVTLAGSRPRDVTPQGAVTQMPAACTPLRLQSRSSLPLGSTAAAAAAAAADNSPRGATTEHDSSSCTPRGGSGSGACGVGPAAGLPAVAVFSQSSATSPFTSMPAASAASRFPSSGVSRVFTDGRWPSPDVTSRGPSPAPGLSRCQSRGHPPPGYPPYGLPSSGLTGGFVSGQPIFQLPGGPGYGPNLRAIPVSMGTSAGTSMGMGVSMGYGLTGPNSSPASSGVLPASMQPGSASGASRMFSEKAFSVSMTGAGPGQGMGLGMAPSPAPLHVRSAVSTGDDGDAVAAWSGARSLAQVLSLLGSREGQLVVLVVMEECDRGSLQQLLSKSEAAAAAVGAGAGPTHGGPAGPAGGGGGGGEGSGLYVPFSGGGRYGALAALRALLVTAKEIALGMAFLHVNNIIHGDLKPGNVLLKSSRQDQRGFVVKISDFGLSRVMHTVGQPAPFLPGHDGSIRMGDGSALGSDEGEASRTSTATGGALDGTVPYLAPELFESGQRSKASDVWAYGVLLWQLITGKRPYEGYMDVQIMAALCSPPTADAEERLKWPQDAHPGLVHLGRSCLSHTARERPTFAQVVRRLQAMEAEVRAA